MSAQSADANRLMLRGAKVQYASGNVVEPKPFDLDDVLSQYVRLPEEARRAFLSIFSHSLTVDVRVALLDRPISDANAARAWQINEWLHQLTGCFHPQSTRDANAEAELIRDIATVSFRYGLERAVGRAVATAAGNTIVKKKKAMHAAGG
ncbi:MAG TPA: hypothetical protein VFX06_09685 [Stellaceae bacterium]|nr:hypothetical protein [Stellaceae bacterium]